MLRNAIYSVMLSWLFVACTSGYVHATGILPKEITIGNDTYQTDSAQDLNNKLVSYFKFIRGQSHPKGKLGSVVIYEDHNSPHITIQHYDKNEGILEFHVTGVVQGRHDDKYEYHARENKLYALSLIKVEGEQALRREGVESPRPGFQIQDNLAHEFTSALHVAGFF